MDVKEYLIDHEGKVDAASPGTGATTTAGKASERAAPLPRETGEVLAQAMLLWSASSLRQYAGLVEAVGRHVPDLARAFQDGHTSDGSERLRACLREIADLSIEEARRLRDQIDRLDLRASGPPGTARDPHWRRWKAKS